MSSISNVGSGIDNWEAMRKMEAKAVQDEAINKIKSNLSDINEAIQDAGDPDADPNDPKSSN